jgi:hypothetical protein
MQVYIPKEIKKEINEIYGKSANPSEVDLPKFISQVLKKKININLIVTKNKEIADQLKNIASREFDMLSLKNS